MLARTPISGRTPTRHHTLRAALMITGALGLAALTAPVGSVLAAPHTPYDGAASQQPQHGQWTVDNLDQRQDGNFDNAGQQIDNGQPIAGAPQPAQPTPAAPPQPTPAQPAPQDGQQTGQQDGHTSAPTPTSAPAPAQQPAAPAAAPAPTGAAQAANNSGEPCQSTTYFAGTPSQWQVPPGCYAGIYSVNPANYVSRSGFGWCNWWVEVMNPSRPDLLWGNYPGGSTPRPGATVVYAPGVQGASAGGHYSRVVAVSSDGYWFLVSEMNFYWRGAGWQKVSYRYVHTGSGISFIY